MEKTEPSESELEVHREQLSKISPFRSCNQGTFPTTNTEDLSNVCPVGFQNCLEKWLLSLSHSSPVWMEVFLLWTNRHYIQTWYTAYYIPPPSEETTSHHPEIQPFQLTTGNGLNLWVDSFGEGNEYFLSVSKERENRILCGQKRKWWEPWLLSIKYPHFFSQAVGVMALPKSLMMRVTMWHALARDTWVSVVWVPSRAVHPFITSFSP